MSFDPTSQVKMNPEVKALWVAKLRDPNIKQGHTNLRSAKEKFCCLGVLCEIAVEHNILKPPVLGPVSDAYTYEDSINPSGRKGLLPEQVREWAGLRSRFGSDLQEHDGRFESMTSLNDRGVPFAKIADLIEEQL